VDGDCPDCACRRGFAPGTPGVAELGGRRPRTLRTTSRRRRSGLGRPSRPCGYKGLVARPEGRPPRDARASRPAVRARRRPRSPGHPAGGGPEAHAAAADAGLRPPVERLGLPRCVHSQDRPSPRGDHDVPTAVPERRAARSRTGAGISAAASRPHPSAVPPPVTGGPARRAPAAAEASPRQPLHRPDPSPAVPMPPPVRRTC
jgi:hypothetical protein